MDKIIKKIKDFIERLSFGWSIKKEELDACRTVKEVNDLVEWKIGRKLPVKVIPGLASTEMSIYGVQEMEMDAEKAIEEAIR